jgi:hypothetical protein
MYQQDRDVLADSTDRIEPLGDTIIGRTAGHIEEDDCCITAYAASGMGTEDELKNEMACYFSVILIYFFISRKCTCFWGGGSVQVAVDEVAELFLPGAIPQLCTFTVGG